MPALKDVSIIGCISSSNAGADNPYPVPAIATWDMLERFVLRGFGWRPTVTQNAPILPPGLRALDIGGNPSHLFLIYQVIALNHEKTTGEPLPLVLKQLEHLRLSEFDFHSNHMFHRFAVEGPFWWLEHLAPSVSNGTLKSLDIPYDIDIQAGFDQLLDKRTICSFSCNALPPTPSFQPGGLLNPKATALLAWLEEFPNLTTVGLFPKDREVCAVLVAKLLSRESSIRTIYTNELVGVYLDDALDKARSKGIRIIRADRVPEPVLRPLE